MAALSEPELVRSARTQTCPQGCLGLHSYTADQTRWCWRNPASRPAAIDVELRENPPAHLVAKLPEGRDFWRAWTQLEVVAKLTDQPVLSLVAEGQLGRSWPTDVALHSLEVAHGAAQATVSVGWIQASQGRPNNAAAGRYAGGMHSSPATVGVALLSMGNRPQELAAALQALGRQEGVELDTVLVGNGWDPEGVPEWVRTHYSPDNLGVTAGRNLAASLTTGEFIFFYDDDGSLPSPDVIRRMVDAMEPGVAVVQARGVDPTGKPSPRRWVPRLRKDAELEGGDVAVFWEAMALIRRDAFDSLGGWCDEFFFGHEGTDLAMRLIDAGWRIRYVPEIEVNHPATPAARHSHHFYTTMRNRVWVARRNIPAPLFPIYLGLWTGATVIRLRSLDALRNVAKGLVDGFRGPTPGGRQPLSWRGVWRMTKLGRPPVW